MKDLKIKRTQPSVNSTFKIQIINFLPEYYLPLLARKSSGVARILPDF